MQSHRAAAADDGALGMEEVRIRVQAEPFDTGREIARLHEGAPRIGAVASFLGVVRDENDERSVGSMRLEHYPGMTERAIESIVRDARSRWSVSAVTIVHRIGVLSPRRSHRARRRRVVPPGRCVRGLRVHHGFSQDEGAVVEEGVDAGRRALGRFPKFRSRGPRALVACGPRLSALLVGGGVGAGRRRRCSRRRCRRGSAGPWRARSS